MRKQNNNVRAFADVTLSPTGIATSESVATQHVYKESYENFQSLISFPAYEIGSFDLIVISKDYGEDPDYNLNFNNIDKNYIFSVENFTIGKNQTIGTDRFAGEGINPQTFSIGHIDNTVTMRFPFRVDSWGYMDFSLAAFFDYCMQAKYGSPTSVLGRFSSTNSAVVGSGTTVLYVDNVAEFLPLTLPFSAKIKNDDTEAAINVQVTGISKANKTLTLSSGAGSTFNRDSSYIASYVRNYSKESTFNLFSVKQGLLFGCMVDKFSINFTPGETVNVDIELKVLGVDRKYQTSIYNQFETIVQKYLQKKPSYLLNGYSLQVSKNTPDYGYFGLGTISDSKVFQGFQKSKLDSIFVDSISLSIENSLTPVYTMNSKSSSSVKNKMKNLLPFAYYSEGRKISGTLTYTGPMKPYLMAEFLSGPSSLNNGGISFNMGPVKLDLPEVVWTAQSQEHSAEQYQKNTVNFQVVTQNYNQDYTLESTGNY
jgi:hypothetical protein